MSKINTIVCSPLNTVPDSLSFYKKLGFTFKESSLGNLYSDGSVLIELNDSPFARPSVKLFKDNWEQEISLLKLKTKVISLDNSILLSAPSGIWVYLCQKSDDYNFELPKDNNSILGNFAGLSLESIDIEASINFWKLLGFSKTSGSVAQGWISLSDSEGMTISIMKPNSCPHLFFKPSLTFFNGKQNMEVIAKIRSSQIPIAQEITAFNDKGIVDNIILVDPGGLGFFIFND